MEDNRIWLGMLDTDRLGRYYGRIADRMQRLHFYFTVGIALSSSAAALSLLTHLPNLVSVVFFFMVAGAVIWASYARYSTKAVVASIIGKQCHELSVDWEQLWFRADESINTLASPS